MLIEVVILQSDAFQSIENFPQKENTVECPLDRQKVFTYVCTPFIYFLSPKHMFIGVSDFGPRKKGNDLKPETSGSVFRTTPKLRSIPPPPWEGHTN